MRKLFTWLCLPATFLIGAAGGLLIYAELVLERRTSEERFEHLSQLHKEFDFVLSTNVTMLPNGDVVEGTALVESGYFLDDAGRVLGRFHGAVGCPGDYSNQVPGAGGETRFSLPDGARGRKTPVLKSPLKGRFSVTREHGEHFPVEVVIRRVCDS